MNWRKAIVRSLNAACTAVDDIAYRPAVVRLALPLPRWWRCDLARLSMWLDDRWEVGWWNSSDAPAAPQGVYAACGRRAAWLEIGGRCADEEPDGSYLEDHPVALCAWCKPDGPFDDAEQVAAALAEARARSISWSWKWRPG